MFWTDRHYPRIESSNLDGTSRRIFVEDFIGKPNALAIDFQNRQLCWTDAGKQTGYVAINPKIGEINYLTLQLCNEIFFKGKEITCGASVI